jgi:competence protein ComEA
MINEIEKFGADKLNLTLTELNGLLVIAFCFICSLIYSQLDSNTLSFEEKQVLIAFFDNINIEKSENIAIDEISRIKAKISTEKSITKRKNLKVDILTASKFELNKIPGIGPKTADDIIEYRTKNGLEFNEDLLKIKGIGDKTFNKIKSFLFEGNFKKDVAANNIKNFDTNSINIVTIETQNSKENNQDNKIDINSATLKEIMNLDGVGKVLAGRIIAYRELQRFEKIEDLMKVEGISKKKFDKVRNFVEIR